MVDWISRRTRNFSRLVLSIKVGLQVLHCFVVHRPMDEASIRSFVQCGAFVLFVRGSSRQRGFLYRPATRRSRSRRPTRRRGKQHVVVSHWTYLRNLFLNSKNKITLGRGKMMNCVLLERFQSTNGLLLMETVVRCAADTQFALVAVQCVDLFVLIRIYRGDNEEIFMDAWRCDETFFFIFLSCFHKRAWQWCNHSLIRSDYDRCVFIFFFTTFHASFLHSYSVWLKEAVVFQWFARWPLVIYAFFFFFFFARLICGSNDMHIGMHVV